jgi:hypothetical protein
MQKVAQLVLGSPPVTAYLYLLNYSTGGVFPRLDMGQGWHQGNEAGQRRKEGRVR